MVKLNLGCGKDVREGWVNLDLPDFDLRQRWTPELITAVVIPTQDQVPIVSVLLPGSNGERPSGTGAANPGEPDTLIKPGEVEEILLKHVLEHLDGDEIKHVMKEAERWLCPGGKLTIHVPFYRCLDMVSDPTHKTPFELQTWDHVDGYSTLRRAHTALVVNPVPLIGLPDDFRFDDETWSLLLSYAETLTSVLTTTIAQYRFRFLQPLIPSLLRTEWSVVYEKRPWA